MTAPAAPPPAAELAALEELAVDVAVEAGALIVEQRPADLGVTKTKSSATDVVTVMDQRAQDLLRARLRAARPADGFLGEEEGGSSGDSPVTWVVDPIDGTVNYLYGIPAYAVSVAAVVGDPQVAGAWAPVAAAVVNPATGELFHARLGGGSWLRTDGSERRLEIPVGDHLGQALVGTGFGYAADVRAWQAEVLLTVLPAVRDIRRIGSAALDLCHVAGGSLDGYYERGLNAWDMAAAWLVVTEAGGVVSGLGEDPPGPAMVVAGAAGLHAALSGAVASAVRAAGGLR
jgi:myo-inositol-1(or 4)-monophosphatase